MTKLQMLLEAEGYGSVEELAASPVCTVAICANLACFDTRDIASNAERPWCPACGTRSLRSALVLAGLI